MFCFKNLNEWLKLSQEEMFTVPYWLHLMGSERVSKHFLLWKCKPIIEIFKAEHLHWATGKPWFNKRWKMLFFSLLFGNIYIYIYIYVYICGIHHWRIFRSSYRKLTWVGFEPTTTEFRSDALNDWAIRPWVQLALRTNFVQLLQFVQC